VGFDLEGNWIYLPKDYSGKEPWGVIVYVSSQSGHRGLPSSWTAVLNAHRFLYICPLAAGNNETGARRCELANSAVSLMRQRYAVNPNRVYIAGFSGGARVACDLGLTRPDLFRGVVAMCGADFYRAVPRVSVTEADVRADPETYGVFNADPRNVQRSWESVHFVFTTGRNDFREHFIEDIVNNGYRPEKFQVELLDDPNSGHEHVDGSTLDKALRFLETPQTSAK
jgi:pimeloyl-ACP methyl ester carboxylesterase